MLSGMLNTQHAANRPDGRIGPGADRVENRNSAVLSEVFRVSAWSVESPSRSGSMPIDFGPHVSIGLMADPD